jgi:hypothetical protein
MQRINEKLIRSDYTRYCVPIASTSSYHAIVDCWKSATAAKYKHDRKASLKFLQRSKSA